MRMVMWIITGAIYGFFGVCGTAFGYEKDFVVLITSYNNEKYAKDNIKSAICQNYSNYRILFVNDCSQDRTMDIVKETIASEHEENKVVIIDNQERKLGLRNYYEAITKYIRDDEIVVALDGDDFFAHKNVLAMLNRVYSNSQKEIWMTYGQFVALNSKKIGWNVKIPRSVVENNSYREFPSVPTHLRTFYAWLFKRIQLQDLMYQGKFFEMTWDCAFMFPMLEMSDGRFFFIDKVVYIYNDNNPNNDHKVNVDLQRFYFSYIKQLPKYTPLPHHPSKVCFKKECCLCDSHKRTSF